MSGLVNNAKKNIFFNFLEIVLSSVLGLISRFVLVNYLGAELIGVNATIVETINLLSMCEFGIQTAISYKMYEAISRGDIERQRQLFSLYKKAYRIVGSTILVLGVLCSPLLPYIIQTDVDKRIVFSAYYIVLIQISLDYYIAYYSVLLITHQKQYIFKRFGVAISSLVTIIQMLIVLATGNLLLYLLAQFLTKAANYIFLRLYSRREFPKIIERCKVNKKDISELIGNIKNLLMGQISAYIYGSTDNILVSSLFGAIFVGYISNYKVVLNIIRSIITAISSALTPSWGELVNTRKNEEWGKLYRLFEYVEYSLGLILVLPTVLLIDDFIAIWLGSSLILGKALVFLFCFEIFLSFFQQPAVIIIGTTGLFKEERNVSIGAAFINLISSILLSQVWGLEGIFAGTIISNLWYLILRKHYVNQHYFSENRKFVCKMVLDDIIYIASFFLIYVLFSNTILKWITISGVLGFFIEGIVCVICACIFVILVGSCLGFSKEIKPLFAMFMKSKN